MASLHAAFNPRAVTFMLLETRPMNLVFWLKLVVRGTTVAAGADPANMVEEASLISSACKMFEFSYILISRTSSIKSANIQVLEGERSPCYLSLIGAVTVPLARTTPRVTWRPASAPSSIVQKYRLETRWSMVRRGKPSLSSVGYFSFIETSEIGVMHEVTLNASEALYTNGKDRNTSKTA